MAYHKIRSQQPWLRIWGTPFWIAPIIVAIVLFGITVSPNTEARQATDLFWHTQKDASSPLICKGYYQPPVFEPLDTQLKASQQPTYTVSDSAEHNQDITRFSGNVSLQKGNRLVTSDQLILNSINEQGHAKGNVMLRRPGLMIIGTEAFFDTQLNTAQVSNSQFVEFDSELRAQAPLIQLNQDDTSKITNGRFTFCPPGDNSWHISGSEIDVLPDKGVAEVSHAVFNINQVPVFYLPWLSVPIDDQRRSGFLNPKVAISSQDGLHLAIPYYANLAPNYDAIITPQIRQKRGYYLGLDGRYLTSTGLLSGHALWVPKDELTNTTRWYANYRFNGQLNNQLSASFDVARASDIKVFSNYDYLVPHADKNKVSSSWQFVQQGASPWLQSIKVGGKHHQQLTTATPSYNIQPYIKASGSSQGLASSSWRYDVSYNNFQRDNQALSGTAKINGQRVHVTPKWQRRWQNSYSFINMAVSIPTSQYQLSDTPTGVNAQQIRSLYQLEFDTGLWFDRSFEISSQQSKQTLEPRLYWTYTPYQDQNQLPVFDTGLVSKPLYQPNRFSGPDRIGDSHRASLSITSRVTDNKGGQKARYSLAQILYLQDQRVQLPGTGVQTITSSPIYGEMDYQITPRLNTNLSLDWKPSDNTFSKASMGANYNAGKDKVINVTYTEAGTSKRQAQASLIWPLGPSLTLFSSYKTNLITDTALEQIVGVEYADCCWKLRLVGRDWLDSAIIGPKQAYFLEMEFKGLGSTNTQVSGIGSANLPSFMKNITGYENRVN